MNKWLSSQGVASRRAIDTWIEQGRIAVNGIIVQKPGVSVDPLADSVEIDGKVFKSQAAAKQKHYLAFYKPKNVVTTLSDPQNRPTIADYLKPYPTRLFPVGRLDYNAEGLLILTNDGEWAQKLIHPAYKHSRIYHVKVKGYPSIETLRKLEKTVELDDGPAKFEDVILLKDISSSSNSWYQVSITIGRYHIVKRLWQAVGHPVLKLIRVQLAGIRLGDMQPGEIRPLSQKERAFK